MGHGDTNNRCAAELTEGVAADLRVRALGHYSRGSRSVTEEGERMRYRRDRQKG